MTPSKRRFFVATLTFASIASALQASPSHAARRLFEVGVDLAGGAIGSPLTPEEAAPVFSTQGYLDFNFLFLHASAETSYVRAGDDDVFEVVADGGIAFAKLHELYYRSGGPNGEMTRIAVGAGGRIGLGGLGDLTLSAGVMAMDWTRPGGSEQSMTGVYAGTKLFLKIWKFENELRVAYYAAPELQSDLTSGGRLVEGWQQGFVGTERLRFNAFKVSIFEFGPEFRARFAELPDGTEWMATLGFGGRIGVL